MSFLKFTDFKNRIVLFDLDDTISVSTAKIKVINPNGNSFDLTPTQFTNFSANPNQKIDTSQFKDPIILRNSLIKWPILNVLKRAMSSSIAVGIVSAR